MCQHKRALLIPPPSTVHVGLVDRVEQETCCEVAFEDGSICDSIPQSDLMVYNRLTERVLMLFSI